MNQSLQETNTHWQTTWPNVLQSYFTQRDYCMNLDEKSTQFVCDLHNSLRDDTKHLNTVFDKSKYSTVFNECNAYVRPNNSSNNSYTNRYQWITLKSCFINLEQTALKLLKHYSWNENDYFQIVVNLMMNFFIIILTLSCPWVPVGTYIDFTLSNAWRFYSPMGKPLGRKGLKNMHGIKQHLSFMWQWSNRV